jgi:hypothetical protein
VDGGLWAAVFVCGLWIVGTHAITWHDYLAFALSLHSAIGVSINTAHELGHKTDRFERRLARITLAPVAYGHFFVEHNRGHHVRVATPPDPAGARYGESFWAFLPRTMVPTWRSRISVRPFASAFSRGSRASVNRAIREKSRAASTGRLSFWRAVQDSRFNAGLSNTSRHPSHTTAIIRR